MSEADVIRRYQEQIDYLTAMIEKLEAVREAAYKYVHLGIGAFPELVEALARAEEK